MVVLEQRQEQGHKLLDGVVLAEDRSQAHDDGCQSGCSSIQLLGSRSGQHSSTVSLKSTMIFCIMDDLFEAKVEQQNFIARSTSAQPPLLYFPNVPANEGRNHHLFQGEAEA